jgi:hypothetical protein
MAYILNDAIKGSCSHGGNASAIVGNPRVKLGGSAVLTIASQLSIAGCSNNPSGTSPIPCTLAMYAVGAARVKCMGMAVLLDSSSSTNIPTGASTTITKVQSRVKGL